MLHTRYARRATDRADDYDSIGLRRTVYAEDQQVSTALCFISVAAAALIVFVIAQSLGAASNALPHAAEASRAARGSAARRL